VAAALGAAVTGAAAAASTAAVLTGAAAAAGLTGATTVAAAGLETVFALDMILPYRMAWRYCHAVNIAQAKIFCKLFCTIYIDSQLCYLIDDLIPKGIDI
jgi:hypothetical protein